ncbi:MAG: hypothetical protein Athens101426_363 [Parcubacteria group bacterium Athens1014_26]|nr:MAG: hypothetical protein Athens101426_363 [Parcubacteria group bacterium Athens1014_26]
MFNERTYTILELTLKEFIGNGKPVSSKQLTKKYKLGVKDATIRAELNNLTEAGFLSQPHISGGRVPTDKGYQFIVNFAMKNLISSVGLVNKHMNQLTNILLNRDLNNFIDGFSQEMNLLGAGYENSTSNFYKSGLGELFENLELETKNDFYEIAKDFERLDEKFKALPRLLNNHSGPQIFIGEKSPITQSRHLAVIIDEYNIDGDKFYIAAIGPKRMDYQKNLKFFKQIKETYERKRKK